MGFGHCYDKVVFDRVKYFWKRSITFGVCLTNTLFRQKHRIPRIHRIPPFSLFLVNSTNSPILGYLVKNHEFGVFRKMVIFGDFGEFLKNGYFTCFPPFSQFPTFLYFPHFCDFYYFSHFSNFSIFSYFVS